MMAEEFSVSGFAGSRILAFALLCLMPASSRLFALEAGGVTSVSYPPSYIVVGFVGGFVRHTNAHHGPVQVAQRLQQDFPKDAHIEIFENRHRKLALKTILHLLDTNQDGVLSEQEKAAARIMLFGQSWGGSAVVVLARELNRLGVPVMMTVQPISRAAATVFIRVVELDSNGSPTDRAVLEYKFADKG